MSPKPEMDLSEQPARWLKNPRELVNPGVSTLLQGYSPPVSWPATSIQSARGFQQHNVGHRIERGQHPSVGLVVKLLAIVRNPARIFFTYA